MTGLVICSIAMIVEKHAIHLNAQLNNTFMTLVVFDIYWECVRATFILLPGYFFFFFWHHWTTSSLWYVVSSYWQVLRTCNTSHGSKNLQQKMFFCIRLHSIPARVPLAVWRGDRRRAMVKPHRRSAVGSFLASHVGQFVKLLQCDAAVGPHVGQSTALSSCFVSLAALYVQMHVWEFLWVSLFSS